MLSKKLLRTSSRYLLSPATDSNSSSLLLAYPFNSNFGINDVSPVIRGSGDSYSTTANDASLDTSVQKFYGSSIQVGSPAEDTSRIKTSAAIPAFGTSNFCIEGWMYVPSIANDNLAIFYNHNGTDAGFQVLLLGSNSGFSGRLYFSGGAGIKATTTSVSVPLNQWFHFACTRTTSGNDLRLFIDGTLRGSNAMGTTNFTLSSIANFCISSNTTYNTVRVQDFRVYQGGTGKYTGSSYTPPGAMFI